MKKRLEGLLAQCGIELNGERSFDIQIKDERVFDRILKNPSLGAGDSYVDGWWDCEALDEFFNRILRYLNVDEIYGRWQILRLLMRNFFFNEQTKLRSKRVAEVHYNIGNDLYEKMLGSSMGYTCGYWSKAQNIDEAQYHKYDLICRKVAIAPGDKVLELGCGWGGFAKYAAEHYGAEVVAVNVSSEQIKYARDHAIDLPIRYVLTDYRNVAQYNPNGHKFDKVVSIGMCEHVGYKNYRHLMRIARQQLKEDGLFLLHTIGKNHSYNYSDPWIAKYIFPNSVLPSIKRLAAASEGHFVVEDLHNFGVDYDKTLLAWHENFVNAWPELKEKYGERFYRMWRYYLLSCAGGFRSRELQLWQFVLSPKGKVNGYCSVR